MAQFYIARSPDQLGCFSLDEVVEKLYSGEFRTDDLAFKEGFPDWKKIGEIPELMDKLKLLQELMDKLIAPTPVPAPAPAPGQQMDSGLPTTNFAPAPAPEQQRFTIRPTSPIIPLPQISVPTSDVSVSPKIPAKPTQTDQVNFSAMSQGQLEAGARFILDIWAHTQSQTEQVKELANEMGRGDLKGTKQGIGIEQGNLLEVHLSLPGFEVADPVDFLTWNGEPVNASFPVTVPKDCTKGLHFGAATIHSHGLMICKLHFQIEIGVGAGAVPEDLTVKTERPRTAFASYSSKNRDEVLGRVQGMEKGNPRLAVTVDRHALIPGQDYDKELDEFILTRDVFYLFWSKSASESKGVEREWRLALDRKGIDYIDVVPLVDPEEVPPPADLASLHFYDKWLAFMRRTDL